MTDADPLVEVVRSLQMARRNLSYFAPLGVKAGIDAVLAKHICRYCDGVASKQQCIDSSMAKGVLPPCAVGERAIPTPPAQPENDQCQD